MSISQTELRNNIINYLYDNHEVTVDDLYHVMYSRYKTNRSEFNEALWHLIDFAKIQVKDGFVDIYDE